MGGFCFGVFFPRSNVKSGPVQHQLHIHASNRAASVRVAGAAAGSADGGGTVVQRHLEQQSPERHLDSGDSASSAALKQAILGSATFTACRSLFWVLAFEGAGISFRIIINCCDSGGTIPPASQGVLRKPGNTGRLIHSLWFPETY